MRPDYSLALVGKHSKLGTDSVVVLRGEVHSESEVLRDCKSRDCTILLVLHNSKSRQVKPSKGKSLMMGGKSRQILAAPALPTPQRSTPHPPEFQASYRIFQEFNLHVDHRPIERADFDHKEERALKQLRRTIVPQTRPVPNFNNPFLPHKSNKETTKPNSPKLRVIRRIHRRTMMMVSPHMR
ncbi:unnamed protein product [Arabidopsis thaliana]|uniref:TPX2 C-terminal domain-containing protein n=1 Tax=Arabidopsis thaliana TaxID=3702 RepID=A0A654G7X2_ARATH|nr:unnamed protein product [Arabidopsis thaliana]